MISLVRIRNNFSLHPFGGGGVRGSYTYTYSASGYTGAWGIFAAPELGCVRLPGMYPVCPPVGVSPLTTVNVVLNGQVGGRVQHFLSPTFASFLSILYCLFHLSSTFLLNFLFLEWRVS